MTDTSSRPGTAWAASYFTLLPIGWPLAPAGDYSTAHIGQVKEWLDFWAQDTARRPLILPATASGRPAWLACCQDEEQARQMAAELMAFVGVAYTDFDPHQRIPPNTTDTLAAKALEQFNWVYRFSVNHDSDGDRVWRALARYRRLMQARPDLTRQKLTSFGDILLDFRKALIAQDEASAVRHFEALRATGRMNAHNEKFLEIHMLAMLGYWPAIVTDRQKLPMLRELPMPRTTFAEAVEAVYQYFLAECERPDGMATAISRFQTEVEPKFYWLFQSRNGVTTPAVMKAFAIFELSRKNPDAGLIKSYLADWPEQENASPVRRWLEATLNDLAATATTQPAQQIAFAHDALENAEYERALRLYLACAPSLDSIRGVLHSADEIEDIGIICQALAYINQCPVEIQAQISPRDTQVRRRLEEKVAQQTAQSAILDWVDWARQVVQGMDREQAVRIAEEKVKTWNLEQFLRQHPDTEELAELLLSGSSDVEATFRRAMPFYYEFFQDTGNVHKALRPVYSAIFNLVYLDGVFSADDLALIQQLSAVRLEAGLSAKDYQILLEELTQILRQAGAFQNLDWALDMAELLAINACQDQAARLQFIASLQGLVAQHGHRLSPEQRVALGGLVKDYPDVLVCPPAADEATVAEGTSFRDFLAGKRVGIYTLTEPAGLRVRDLLKAIAPTCQVVVNSDKVATTQLKELAARSDIFVFAWRSSKHQAFYGIRAARGSKPLIMAAGKGTSSILEAIRSASV